ncbi:sensor histidine kinase [Oceanobacillus jeddahense]|uniref:sensor histidine kinase n=1 Tax=Oceanobacillus jeddahense TaxID=1462527 RepID=UPI00059619C7|nr:ATP-binding protein [Oceanobacillus jeddahense]
MLQNKWGRSFLPKRLLFQLTFINIIVIVAFVMLSSWAIYNTACTLADGLTSMTAQKQNQFQATLFQYLWIFSISAVILGSLIHFYLTKKMIQPLKELIQSTKEMKQGKYPSSIHVKGDSEVVELIHHFNDLVQKLETNEQQRKNLVSDLSHEFRTPLTNLNGYLLALQNGVMEGDEKLYQSLYTESSKLTQLVEQMEQLKEWDDMQTYSFNEKEPIDMQEFIERSIEIFQWSLEKKQIKLEVDIQPGVAIINRTNISQVISNLMDNAIRYYDGVEPIIVKGEKLLNEYKVSITGPGRSISEKDKERIFERFYRIENSRSREFGGSGLGLAISKEIIERHYGKIGVNSGEHMHTFWFVIPL